MVSKFGIYSQAVISVWVVLPQVAMLRTCPIMTLAVERDVKSRSFLHLFFMFWSVNISLALHFCLSLSLSEGTPVRTLIFILTCFTL